MTQQSKTGFQHCPVLGVGLGLRTKLHRQTLAATDLLDWVEITPENYMGKGGRSRQRLNEAKGVYPLVPHGVTCSIGSTDPWDESYIKDLKQLTTEIKAPWFSDHLCFSGVDGVYFNDLIPLPRTQETVKHLAGRIKFLQDELQIPILVENISYYVEYPQNQMPDDEFTAAVVEAADCGLLLDVNNVYVNSQNHGWDAKQVFKNLPLDRVVQIHVAGHDEFSDNDNTQFLVDTHGAEIKEDVWTLLDWVLSQPNCNPCGVMVERDNNIPACEDLLPEVKRLRQLWDTHCSQTMDQVKGVAAS